MAKGRRIIRVQPRTLQLYTALTEGLLSVRCLVGNHGAISRGAAIGSAASSDIHLEEEAAHGDVH
jgi:hypothetical protein